MTTVIYPQLEKVGRGDQITFSQQIIKIHSINCHKEAQVFSVFFLKYTPPSTALSVDPQVYCLWKERIGVGCVT